MIEVCEEFCLAQGAFVATTPVWDDLRHPSFSNNGSSCNIPVLTFLLITDVCHFKVIYHITNILIMIHAFLTVSQMSLQSAFANSSWCLHLSPTPVTSKLFSTIYNNSIIMNLDPIRLRQASSQRSKDAVHLQCSRGSPSRSPHRSSFSKALKRY